MINRRGMLNESELVTFPCNADGRPLVNAHIDLGPEGLWPHPADEPSRVSELEDFLRKDFDTFREVRIERQFLFNVPLFMRIDLLAVPKVAELVDAVLAFEVKRDRFDVEMALKQSADYVGGRVVEGPHRGKRIAACFLYPIADIDRVGRGRSGYQLGMFNLIAQWRVGRAFVSRYGELTLSFGFQIIWRSQRGWVETKAGAMLLGQRTVGGSRRDHTVARLHQHEEDFEEDYEGELNDQT